MTEMPPSSNDSSVKRGFQEPQTTGQTQRSPAPAGRSPVHVKTFLKNNAFVGITVTAVVIGKCNPMCLARLFRVSSELFPDMSSFMGIY